MRRKKMSKRSSKRNFKKHSKIHSANSVNPRILRGGIRL